MRAIGSSSSSIVLAIVLAGCILAPGDLVLAKQSGESAAATGNELAKLVRMFSKPGAFKQVDSILGEGFLEGSGQAQPTCPEGDEGLDCRRAEARRSADCPRGDCICYSCSSAGPKLWAECCREGLKCCSHLAAACRTCDQPALFPFCAKHFKKCINYLNEKKN